MSDEAHRLRNKRHRATLDQLVITVPKGAKDGIKEHVASKSTSINAYVVSLIENDIGLTMRELAQKKKENMENAPKNTMDL